MYIVAAFIPNIIQRSRERFKKVRKNSKPFSTFWSNRVEKVVIS